VFDVVLLAVDEAWTSQRCHKCQGRVTTVARCTEQVCENCGPGILRDYNSGKNIAAKVAHLRKHSIEPEYLSQTANEQVWHWCSAWLVLIDCSGASQAKAGEAEAKSLAAKGSKKVCACVRCLCVFCTACVQANAGRAKVATMSKKRQLVCVGTLGWACVCRCGFQAAVCAYRLACVGCGKCTNGANG
jgi:hypothetical protein